MNAASEMVALQIASLNVTTVPALHSKRSALRHKFATQVRFGALMAHVEPRPRPQPATRPAVATPLLHTGVPTKSA